MQPLKTYLSSYFPFSVGTVLLKKSMRNPFNQGQAPIPNSFFCVYEFLMHSLAPALRYLN